MLGAWLCLSSYDKTLSDACSSLADKWNESNVIDLSQFKPTDIDQFSAYQKKAFLSILLQHVSYTAAAWSAVIWPCCISYTCCWWCHWCLTVMVQTSCCCEVTVASARSITLEFIVYMVSLPYLCHPASCIKALNWLYSLIQLHF